MSRPTVSGALQRDVNGFSDEIRKVKPDKKNEIALMSLHLQELSLVAQIEILKRIEDRGW